MEWAKVENKELLDYQALSFEQLKKGHIVIVEMLRETERIFAPILQFYYASCVSAKIDPLFRISSKGSIFRL